MIARAPQAGPKAGLIALAALVTVLAAGRAEAQCQVDTDCPNSACGGEVCTKSSGLSSCTAADTQGASGLNDGWCVDADGGVNDDYCKCKGMGATCNGLYCTLTVPPTGTGGSGVGGSTGTGGSGTGGSGTAGAAGGSGGTTAGGGGGCSVAGAPALGGAAGICLMLAALIRARASRRRTRG